jgi:transcriptional regulator with PAS, ATPase and Fis domain
MHRFYTEETFSKMSEVKKQQRSVPAFWEAEKMASLLVKHNNNSSNAAREMGITPTLFHSRMRTIKKYAKEDEDVEKKL